MLGYGTLRIIGVRVRRHRDQVEARLGLIWTRSTHSTRRASLRSARRAEGVVVDEDIFPGEVCALRHAASGADADDTVERVAGKVLEGFQLRMRFEMG